MFKNIEDSDRLLYSRLLTKMDNVEETLDNSSQNYY